MATFSHDFGGARVCGGPFMIIQELNTVVKLRVEVGNKFYFKKNDVVKPA